MRGGADRLEIETRGKQVFRVARQYSIGTFPLYQISHQADAPARASPLHSGDELEFNFNFATPDGAGYADYGWARLLDSSSSVVAPLFTARTTPEGNSVPGFDMPVIDATICQSKRCKPRR
ncbi:MAG TPA: hypothetical protein VMV78_01650 [Thiobacillus sp.]|nr:hypothetical protein [Thiobacillus sp.]